MGIEPPPPQWDVADYVLSRFRKEELDEIAIAKEKAADAVDLWCRESIDICMSRIKLLTQRHHSRKNILSNKNTGNGPSGVDELLITGLRFSGDWKLGDAILRLLFFV